jgi:hypothetical protein
VEEDWLSPSEEDDFAFPRRSRSPQKRADASELPTGVSNEEEPDMAQFRTLLDRVRRMTREGEDAEGKGETHGVEHII